MDKFLGLTKISIVDKFIEYLAKYNDIKYRYLTLSNKRLCDKIGDILADIYIGPFQIDIYYPDIITNEHIYDIDDNESYALMYMFIHNTKLLCFNLGIV